ncbi:MAG: methionyl-tRNA formyltransferase [Magnetococcales bacterium]|nr:methionyl-tRNA formyltransferase [Magnetococcales bacterium]MBF0321489.1 methionyl-tRNA formyltransferase [Magnetococcales bacterium]
MRIVYFGKGERGAGCLERLYQTGRELQCVIVHPGYSASAIDPVANVARRMGTPVLDPVEPNTETVATTLAKMRPDLFVLGGYGKILKQNLLDIPRKMTINLHGGKLPEYRGSSPMNWALIRGDPRFSISIIKVDAGIDTGDILAEKAFSIGPDDTIHDLHRIANSHFPEMLIDVISSIDNNTITCKKQDQARASYYPMRFPDDGGIVWDMLTAREIHNRIRALTEPYPCAYALFGDLTIKLIASKMPDVPYYGEPGRVYQVTDKGLLVCASDRCLWISRFAAVNKDGGSAQVAIKRYDRFVTMRQSLLKK